MSRTRLSLLTALVASLLLVPTATLAVDASPSPNATGSEAASSGQGRVDDPFAGSIAIEPDPSIVDPAPVPWERLEIGPDGRHLRVFFFGGAPECHGLARVEVERSGEVPTVTVWMGLLGPDPAERICPAIALPYHVDIDLEEALVQDGARAEEPADADGASPISLREALTAPEGESVLVRGSLLAEPGEALRLWEALLESYPPQGADPSLSLEGLDEDSIELQEAEGVRWNSDVTLRGTVRDGTLVVSEVVQDR